MINKFKLKIIVSSVVVLLPMIVGFSLWDKLPDSIATSFDWNGNITGYSSKTFAVVGLPAVLLVVNLICIAASCCDPKAKNISGKFFTLILCIIPVCSILCETIIYCKALDYNLNIANIFTVFIGILFIILGCFLPKCKQNYTVGIKLAWTLHDEENWHKTHKMAGPLWIGGGILIILAGLFQLEIVFAAAIIALGIIPAVYSYLLYKNK